MTRKSRVIAILGAAVLTIGLLPGQAPAVVRSPSSASATCLASVVSLTDGGDLRSQYVESTVPPKVTGGIIVARDVYPDGQVRLASSMWGEDVGGFATAVNGYVVMGDALYGSSYWAEDGAATNASLRRVGGGWSSFKALEMSYYSAPYRATAYGLRGDGVLFRWTVTGRVWGNKTSYPGFAAVKSMVLISKTRTYDTFLANTRGGALYTIHIPLTSPLKPIVKLVRRSTWQVFESMVSARCGQYGTLLLGIDKDTKAGYLYAVGHANGLATVILGRGKVPAAFADSIYGRWTGPEDTLFGE